MTCGIGKRELAQLSAFELLLLVTVGDLVQQGVTQEDFSVTGALLGVGTIGLWILAFSYASFRWPRARQVLEGRPVVIARDGEALTEHLAVERLTLDDLLSEARQHGIADLRDVDYAVLEPDGKFAFLVRGREELRDADADERPAE